MMGEQVLQLLLQQCQALGGAPTAQQLSDAGGSSAVKSQQLHNEGMLGMLCRYSSS